MKFKLTLLLFLLFKLSSAQPFKYPAAPNQGKQIKSLVPPQWKIIDSISGDLNNDQVDDLALVIEFYAAVKENRAYGDSTTELITEIQRPRMLLIYFKSGRNYKLITQNNHFILRSEEGGAMGDPLRPMTIRDNQLRLSFEGGGDWRWKLNYSFKYQNGDWSLLAAGNYAFHPGSGEMNSRQYDFVNKKCVLSSGTVENKKNTNSNREQALSVKTLRTFSSFKKPWTWEIRPNEFL